MKKKIFFVLLSALVLIFSIVTITVNSSKKNESLLSDTYSVTWKNHDGTILETDSDVVHGSTPSYDGATPTKAHDDPYAYTFSGWSPTISSVTADIIYTAQFTSSATKCTISFDSNGGNSINSQVINIGGKAIAPENPTREGYTFEGWYLNDEAWSFANNQVTEPATLVAKWNINSFHLSLDYNEEHGTVTGNGDYNYGSSATITATPIDGYFFDGWYQGTEKISNNAETEISIGSSNKSLEAKFITGSAYFEKNYKYTQDESGITITGVKDKEIKNLVVPEEFDGNPIFRIQRGAFKDCTNLTSITLPFIGDGTSDNANFGYIFGASTYSTNSDYVPTSLKKVIITKANNIDDYAFIDCSSLTSITLPEGIKEIAFAAFSDCSSLTSITMPNSLEIIGMMAFNECSSLTSIIIPEGVKIIQDHAFYHCSGLIEIEIPDSVKSIGYGAFSSCKSLTEIRIPNGVESLESSVFTYCSSLREIIIPESVTSIERTMFFGCNSLSSIIIDPNNPVYDSRDNCNAIIETNTDTLIEGCKGSFIPNSVKRIAEYAFNGCSGLTEITIPNSVKSIETMSFSRCSSLTEIIIPDSIESIEQAAFSSCSGLTEILIPKNIESIASDAFAGCSSLESIIVDSNNLKFDSRDNCNAIIETDTNTLILGCKTTIIQNTVKSLGNNSFSGCSGLTSITIPNSIENMGFSVFNGCSNLTSIIIPNTVTSIGNYAFSGCERLTEITLPDNIKSIPGGAFSGCIGLTSFEIPDSVESIGGSAFRNCTGLIELTIPENVKSIGSFAFEECSSLASITIPGSVIDLEWRAFIRCSNLKEIEILNGVKNIGEAAFYGCSALESITIPESIESIHISAFNNCNNLSSIIVNPSNVTYDSRNNCNAIIVTATNTLIKGCKTTIIPDSVKSINYAAFSGCSGLSSITIPSSIESIGDEAFSDCKGLTEITIQNGVKSIGYNAFDNCIGLSSITIPSSIESIGDEAFSDCKGLTEITIQNGVKSINYFAFSGCSALSSIIIPSSIESIEACAFLNCSSLEEVVFENPNGWHYGTSLTDESKTAITGLDDKETAATYLCITLSDYSWYHIES